MCGFTPLISALFKGQLDSGFVIAHYFSKQCPMDSSSIFNVLNLGAHGISIWNCPLVRCIRGLGSTARSGLEMLSQEMLSYR